MIENNIAKKFAYDKNNDIFPKRRLTAFDFKKEYNFDSSLSHLEWIPDNFDDRIVYKIDGHRKEMKMDLEIFDEGDLEYNNINIGDYAYSRYYNNKGEFYWEKCKILNYNKYLLIKLIIQ